MAEQKLDKELNKKYVKQMEELIPDSCDDPEQGHAAADALLCELLEELGYADVIEKYNEVEKFYS